MFARGISGNCNPPHEVWVAESFVDTQLFRGTAYNARGRTELGATQDYTRCGKD